MYQYHLDLEQTATIEKRPPTERPPWNEVTELQPEQLEFKFSYHAKAEKHKSS